MRKMMTRSYFLPGVRSCYIVSGRRGIDRGTYDGSCRDFEDCGVAVGLKSAHVL